MAPSNLPMLATTPDVEALLGSTVTTAEDAQVAAWLRATSSLVRGYCKQTISLVLGDTYPVWPDTLISDIWLPELPVVAVTAVEPMGSASYDFDPLTGQLFLKTGQWLDPVYALTLDYTVLGPLRITYDHGNDVIPDLIVDLVASKVAHRVVQQRVNPEFLRGELIEGYRAYYPDMDATLTLTDGEKGILRDAGFRRTAYMANIR